MLYQILVTAMVEITEKRIINVESYADAVRQANEIRDGLEDYLRDGNEDVVVESNYRIQKIGS